MSLIFEELDYQQTPLGEISLRRRAEPRLNEEILYEVKLGDEFLMSSLFTEAEIQLANLGLLKLHESALDVVVGGLGLGYTAVAALENSALRSLKVIEVMAPVIDWHRRGLVPLGQALCSDPRCELVLGNFFALASSPGQGFGPGTSGAPVHAILLDIDHSPGHWLNPENEMFYTEQSLRNMALKLHPGGIFGLWSNVAPEPAFSDLLGRVFESVEAHIISFPNPYSGAESSNTVYLARKQA
jgi:spermidine synthase